MTTDSPVVVLFNSDGYEVNVKPGVAIPAGTTAIIAAGSDGTNSRFMAVDSSGRPIIVGAGTAGSPVGGVVSIQGVASGTPIPISGSVSVANASIGITGAAIPASATQIGGSDGTNLQVPRVFDNDTGGGTQYVLGVNLRLSGSGGSVEFGTNTNPIRIDPTGTTTQPISAVALPLPAGAATEATLATRLADATFTARINTLGQKTMANSTPVVLASDQTVIPVSQSGTWTVQPGNTANTTPWLITISQGGNAATVTASNALKVDGSAVTQPVSGTVTANIGTTGGLALDATLTGGSQLTRITDGTNQAAVKAPSTAAVAGDRALVVAISPNNTIVTSNASVGATGASPPASATYIGGSVTTAAPSYTTGQLNALSLTTGGLLRIDGSGVTQPISGTVTANQGTNNTLANRWPVIVTDGTNTMPTADTVGRSSFHRITDGTNTAAVKAASTAAVVGDPALVVAISPNNTIVTSNASVGATGATPPASATYIGGSVTTAAPTYTTGQMNALSLTTTGHLRAQTISESATGAAVPAIAEFSGGTDGTNVRAFLTDTSGRQIVIGAAASGAAVAGNPVLMAGSDGTNARTLKTLTDGTQVTRYKELATFTGMATDIAVANNKSMLSIVNASGSAVTARISAIYVTSVQTTGVTGVVGNFELRRITNHSAGTAITAIERMDSNDSLNASITVRTNGTVTSESTNLLWRSVFSTDEWSVNNAIDTAAEGHLLSTMFPIWKRADFDNKPIILNANEGLTIKFATNSSVGTFDIMIVFTQE